MDLAQKANRVKRDLQAAVQRPEATSVRHAIEAFDAFVDGVVEEIGSLKAQSRSGSTASGTGESIVPEAASETVAPTPAEQSERTLEAPVTG